MKIFTEEEVQAMTERDARTHIVNSVYEATRLIEQLERAGKVRGNGHHARQKLAKLAEDEVTERWVR